MFWFNFFFWIYSTKYEYPNGTGAHALNETFETEGSNNDDNNGNNNNYSDIEADSDGAPEKKRRTHLDFILERVFDNKNQAEEALKAEGEYFHLFLLLVEFCDFIFSIGWVCLLRVFSYIHTHTYTICLWVLLALGYVLDINK